MARVDDLRLERDDLEKKLTGLVVEQRRVIWGSIVGFAAIPVGIVWGGLAALAAVGITLGVIGVSLYIIHGHRYEYESRLRNIDAELKAADSLG